MFLKKNQELASEGSERLCINNQNIWSMICPCGRLNPTHPLMFNNIQPWVVLPVMFSVDGWGHESFAENYDGSAVGILLGGVKKKKKAELMQWRMMMANTHFHWARLRLCYLCAVAVRADPQKHLEMTRPEKVNVNSCKVEEEELQHLFLKLGHISSGDETGCCSRSDISDRQKVQRMSNGNCCSVHMSFLATLRHMLTKWKKAYLSESWPRRALCELHQRMPRLF